MIRIDHVLGLMQIFRIPECGDEGAYVDYPFDALLAVVATESARSGTVVIGGDLGLVPPGLRARLAATGVYGLDVLLCMRTTDGGFEDASGARGRRRRIRDPRHADHRRFFLWRRRPAPPRLRRGGMALLWRRPIADRRRAKQSLGGADPVEEIHRRLARARSAISEVQIEDVAETETRRNLPRAIDEHPNWRRIAPFSTQEIETSPAFARLGAVIRVTGRGRATKLEREYELQDD